MPSNEFLIERRSADLEHLSSYGRRRLRLGFLGQVRNEFVPLSEVDDTVLLLIKVLAYRSAQLKAAAPSTNGDATKELLSLGSAAFSVAGVTLRDDRAPYDVRRWLSTGQLPAIDADSRSLLEIVDQADRSATRLLLTWRTANARAELGDQLNVPVEVVGPRIAESPAMISANPPGGLAQSDSALEIQNAVRHLTSREWFLPTGPSKRIATVVAAEAQSWLTTAEHTPQDRSDGLLSAIDWLVNLAVERLVLLDDLLQALAASELNRVIEHLDTYVIAAWSSPMVAATHISQKCPLGPAADAAEELAADALSLLDLIRFTGYQWSTVASPTYDVIDQLRSQIAAAQWLDDQPYRPAA